MKLRLGSLIALLVVALVVGSIHRIDRHRVEDTSGRVIVEISDRALVRVSSGPTSRDQTVHFEGPLFVWDRGDEMATLVPETMLGMFRAIVHSGVPDATIQIQAAATVPWNWVVRMIPNVSQEPRRFSTYAFRLDDATAEVVWTLPPHPASAPAQRRPYVHYHLRQVVGDGTGPPATFVDRVPGLVMWPDSRPGPIDNGLQVPRQGNNPIRLGSITQAALRQQVRDALVGTERDPVRSVILSAPARDRSRLSYGDAWRFLDAAARAGAPRTLIKLALPPPRGDR